MRAARATSDYDLWHPARSRERPPLHHPKVRRVKWTAADFAEYKARPAAHGQGRQIEWSIRRCRRRVSRMPRLVLDETFVTPDTSHQTLETAHRYGLLAERKGLRSHGTQSTVQTVSPARWRWLNMEARDQIVLISEYTGGGFGSKTTGYILAIIPAMLSKKVNAPVHDAHQPRGRAFHRARASRLPGPDEDRLLHGRADHRDGHARHLQQRAL